MLKDLVMKSRSYRGYNQNRKVTKEELMSFVDVARFCPSSVNEQPLRYYLVYEEEMVAKIQKETGWAMALKDVELPHPGSCPTAFIVILQDIERGPNRTRFIRDVGAVAQTILLAATEAGLGGCMLGSFHAGHVKEILQLDDHLIPMLVVAIGEPAEQIILEEVEDGESVTYYRDENDLHHVPKRKLEDIILG